VRRHRTDRFIVTRHVRLIERSVHFVEDTERGGAMLENRKNQADCGERLLTARHQLNIAEFLAGGLRHDVYARYQEVIRIRQAQFRSSATEVLSKRLLEEFVDRIEGFSKTMATLFVHVFDGALKLNQGF